MALVGTRPICRLMLSLHTPRYETLQTRSDVANFRYQWNYASSFIYLASLFGYKFTILLLYLRLFNINDKFRYTTWAVMFFVFGYLFSNLLTSLAGCSPFYLNWGVGPGHCLDRPKEGLAYGSMNFISDLFIFVLPMPMVWGLRLSRKGKLGVMLVFMGGGM